MLEEEQKALYHHRDSTIQKHPSMSHVSLFPRLFGVDQQQQQLLDAFQRCLSVDNKHPELSIIAGPSGSGKTVLAQTLQDHCKFLVVGKCDQFQIGSEPFGAFIIALSRLADEIVQKNNDVKVLQWFKSRAQQSLSEDAEINLLLDTVPMLAGFFPNMVMSKNRQIDRRKSMAATTAKRSNPFGNPTMKIISKFLRAVSSPEHPIVLIVDDVQWIDSSSLELLEDLSSQKEMTAGLMIVATCRDDEVPHDHPFSHTIRNLQLNEDTLITNIQVGSLSIETISKLVVDRFPTLAGKDLKSLSTVLQSHAQGNAFFTTQILHRLESSGWKPSTVRGNCEGHEDWDSSDERSMINHLTALDCSALVDIVVSDAANESPSMKEVMMAASCLGSGFVTSHVMAVTSESTTDEHVQQALLSMQEKEFIRPHLDGEGWSWAHDKFQAAAYILIDRKQRELFHRNVGRRLISFLSNDELEQFLFIVVSQFCLALKKLEEDEMEGVAELLLRAGKRSAQSSSFGKAASYIAIGTSLLKTDNWESQYELSVRLYSAAATMECCKGNYVEADKLVTVILRHTRSLKDRLQAIETKVFYLVAKEEHNQVMCLTLDVLDQLGEKFPRKPRLPMIIYEIMSTRWMLSKLSVDDVLSLQPMTDWKKLAVLRILQVALASFIRTSETLMPIVICRSIKLSLKYGLCSMACHSYAAMYLILTHSMQRLNEGEKCVRISEGIVKKYGVEDFTRCKIDFFLKGICRAMKTPLRGLLQEYQKAASVGLLSGDVDTACICLRTLSLTMLFCGERLEAVISVAGKNSRNFHSWDQPVHEQCEKNIEQLLENLTNFTTSGGDPCSFTGKFMNEKQWLEKSNAGNDDTRNSIFWVFKIFVAVYLAEYETAKEFVGTLQKYNWSFAQAATLFQTHFLCGLVDVIVAREKYPSNSSGGCGGGGSKAKKYKSSLKNLRLYGKDVPANVSNKILLIEAEADVLRYGKCDGAISKFHQSIDEAKRHGIIQEEAFANERCAIAMLEWGDVAEALEYFERAKSLYEQWGSPVKVVKLIKFVEERSGVTMSRPGM